MSGNQPIYLGVIGKPIFQSLSPIIHETALKQLGLSGKYLRLAAESIKEATNTALEMGLKGLNVTSPFKEDLLNQSQSPNQEGSLVGAANTIVFGQNSSVYNTDLYGVLCSLGLSSNRADGKTALVIGAGGAAKSAAFALKQVGCKVYIANRTQKRAEDVALKFGINQISFDDAAVLLKNTDYIVNTVVSSDELIILTHLQPHTLILDAIYAKPTPFSESCKESPNYIDGRNWLLYQGVRAFELFTGLKVGDSETEIVKNALFQKVNTRKPTISLIGMMGSGKSGVGKSLRSVLGGDFIDLDQLVEQKAGRTISKLVSDKGEDVFRKLESRCLAEALESKPRVLSCGGGIIGDEANRKLLGEQTSPVWLWASKDDLVKRLAKSESRPLLHGYDLATRVSQLLDQRFYHYAEVSELVIATEDKSTTEIAERIAYEVFNVE